MNRLDPAINNLPVEELRNLVFQGTWAPVAVDVRHLDKYRKLVDLLRTHPIHNRRICLIAAPQLKPEAANHRTAIHRRYMTYLPHGFMYLSAAIRNFMPSWSVQILDLNHESLKRTVLGQDHDFEALLGLIPDDCDLYGVTMMFDANGAETLRCTEYLTSKGKFVIAGGGQASVDFENLLTRGYCSVVVKKEGETQVCKLLSLWEKTGAGQSERNGYQEIYNLAFRYGDEIISFEDRFENPVAFDIRREYSLIDLDEYNRYGSPNIWCRIAAPGRKWATLLTTRGCRGHCTFCQVSGIMGHGARSRAVSDVLDEILFLYQEQAVRHIEFPDDDFLANRPRSLELLRRLAELKLDLTFAIGSGVIAVSIDEELAQSMADAGCVMIGFGVETGNEERLKALRKPVSLKQVRDACEIFKKNQRHIWLQANFMLGFPNETYRELMNTFDYARSLEIDYCQSSMLTPIVGTPVYEQLVSIGDERVTDRFGKPRMAAVTAGRALVSRGLTFDDAYKEVYDFRKVEQGRIPGSMEIQQFQIYFNVFINLIGSVNLKPGGMPEKIKSFTDDVLKAYPMDAVSWGVNAQAAKLLGDEQQYEISAENYRKAVRQSTFWSMFFEVYDVPKLLGIPV